TIYTPGTTRVTVTTPTGAPALTLYAKWASRADVTYSFVANNSAIDSSSMPQGGTVKYNAHISEPAAIPVAAGYSFDGWYTAQTGGERFAFAGTGGTGTRVVQTQILYAHWNARSDISVSFAPNGGSGVNVVSATMPKPFDGGEGNGAKIKYNAALPLSVAVPYAPGYSFAGWFDTAAATGGTQYVLGQTRIVATAPAGAPAVTLYARWKKENPVSVTFNDNRSTVADAAPEQGTMPDNMANVPYGSTLDTNIPTPVVLGYAFLGWYDIPGASGGQEFVLGAADSPRASRLVGNTTLYARFAQQPNVSVTFDTKVPQGAPLVAGTAPAPITGLAYNSTITPTKPAVSGYRFTGWKYDVSEGGQTVARDFRTGADGDRVTQVLALYATWEEVPALTVRFAANLPSGSAIIGGTMPESIPNQIYNTTVSAVGGAASVPESVGKRFTGWYTEAAGGTPFEFGRTLLDAPVASEGDGEDATYHITLYAHWEDADDVKARYDQGAVPSLIDGTMPDEVSVRYSSAIGAAPSVVPESVGKRFTGWYTAATGGAEFDFASRLTTHTAIYAQWTDGGSFEVSFDGNASDGSVDPGSLPPAASVPYSGTYISVTNAALNAEPIRSGYTFAGWYTTSACAVEFDFAHARIKGATTVYAKWAAHAPVTIRFNKGGTGASAVYDDTMPPTNNAVPYNGTLPAGLATPVAVGYSFGGWYTAPNGEGDPADGRLRFSAASTTLYANWVAASPFTLTYDANVAGLGGGLTSGAVVGMPSPSAVSVKQNANVMAPGGTPAVAGYSFEGWQLDAAGTSAFVFATDMEDSDTSKSGVRVSAPSGSMTLFAKWAAHEAVSVRFSANLPGSGGSSGSGGAGNNLHLRNMPLDYDGSDSGAAKLTYNTPLPADTSEPALDGYKFVGWFTTSAATGGAQYIAGGSRRVSQDELTLYARWSKQSDVSIMFSAFLKPAGTSLAEPLPDEVELPYNGRIADYLGSQYVSDSGSYSPVIVGYEFVGWFGSKTVQDETTLVDFASASFTSDTTLYGKWYSAPDVTVVFDGNKPDGSTGFVSGLPPAYTNVLLYSTIAAPSAAPKLLGYDFAGWSLDAGASADSAMFDFANTRVNPDNGTMTLYAIWEQGAPVPKVQLSFDKNLPSGANEADLGAFPSDPAPVDSGTVAAAPTGAVPSLAGYDFTGWFADSGCETPFAFGSVVLTRDTRVYAGWSPVATGGPTMFTLTYVGVAPEGSYIISGTMPEALTVSVEGDTAIERPEPPQAVGYEFAGWYSSPSYNSPIDFDNGISANTYAFTKWTPHAPVSLTFSANAGGASADIQLPSNMQVAYNSNAQAPSFEPARVGYSFEGWMSQASVSPNQLDEYMFDWDTRLTEDTVVYAYWQIQFPVAVAFDANRPADAVASVQGMPTSRSVEYGGTLSAPDERPTLDGYRFAGWSTSRTTQVAFDFDNKRVTGSLTLYASWTKMDDPRVTWVSDRAGLVDSTFPKDGTVKYGSVLSQPDDPQRVGYEFGGWYADEEYHSEFVFGQAVRSDVSVYVKWTAKSAVSIAYHLHLTDGMDIVEGSPTSDRTNRNVAYGSTVLLDTLVCEGYRFDGWWSADISSDAAFQYDNKINTLVADSDKEVHARWMGMQNVTLTFSGAEGVAAQDIVYNSKPTRPTDPATSGFTFGGWYADSAFKSAFDFTARLTADKTVYAKWTKVGGGGGGDNPIPYDPPKPPDPPKPLYPDVRQIKTPMTQVNLSLKKSYTAPIVMYGPDGKPITDTITWTTSNANVATVAGGKIKAGKKPGKAVITGKARNGATVTIKVTVVKKAVKLKKFKIKAPAKMKIGQTAVIAIKLSQKKATNLKVSFTTAPKKVAAVDKAGKITALKKGTVTVTVKIGKVKVKKKIKVS
ncbi:MAG: InlB B-repeat-containing protein, partial [Clostridiales Family XIII bacterium]|nr:InlB B-repeat-containing protein [Clostridiales Family XIII bacterium]